jgi:hypothetical protein
MDLVDRRAIKYLRVSKWVGQIPVVGVCTLSNRELRIPMIAMNRVSDAQESLKLQFAQHTCTVKSAKSA